MKKFQTGDREAQPLALAGPPRQTHAPLTRRQPLPFFILRRGWLVWPLATYGWAGRAAFARKQQMLKRLTQRMLFKRHRPERLLRHQMRHTDRATERHGPAADAHTHALGHDPSYHVPR